MSQDRYYEAHVSYVRSVVPLMIHYLWRRVRQEPTAPPLAEMLACHVDIWRKTLHYNGGAAPSDMAFCHDAWTAMRDTLVGLFARYKDDANSDALEQACLDYLWPLMEPRLLEDSRPPRKDEARPYGAWTVTFRENNVMSVHIANAYRPDSVFDYPEDFAGDLLRLIYDTCAEHPHIQTLFCGSWMNNLPPFQRFFPPEWVWNLHRPVYHNDTYGIWGQYMTRTGGFHPKNAARIRDRGMHRYPLIHGQCGIRSAITHLESNGWRDY